LGKTTIAKSTGNGEGLELNLYFFREIHSLWGSLAKRFKPQDTIKYSSKDLD